MRLSSLFVFVSALFVFVKVFDGPIRFLFVSLGFPILVYIPTFALLACLLIWFLHNLGLGRISKFNLVVIYFILLFIAIGILNTGRMAQVAIGVYFLLPFLFGLIVPVTGFFELKRFYIFCWIMSIIGIYADYYIDFPWKGFSYEIGENRVIGNLNWHTLGFERLSGFSRTSFDAAIYLLTFALPVVIALRRPVIKLLVWILTAIGVVLTTTKGVIVALLVVSAFSLIPLKYFKPVIIRMSLFFFVLVSAILPVLAYFQMLSLSETNPIAKLLLKSLDVRIKQNWPEAFDLILNEGNAFTGRGIGGIGTSQRYFELSLYAPGDNLIIYLFGLFGLFGLFIVFYLAYLAGRLELRKSSDFFIYLMLLFFVVYGLTTSVLEAPLIALMLGSILNYLYYKKNVPSIENSN